ncbi:MAG: 50S ribosomal protein L3 [Candidatus Calescibacterium sp.]|nr:50S ribosomal protein L3 [Candidatus Calescibacterium sp.]MCX7972700.1 50S ribosomal protein L3 [bacterium]MDW8195504.1 50S ribosomal protein L3 [Candidatus Calescibacterium sp.]
MKIGILGIKIGMTEIYQDNELIPVTAIMAGPCKVIDIKTPEKDGYYALKVGFIKTDNLNKPSSGVFKKVGEKFKIVAEIRVNQETASKYKIGDVLDVNVFNKNDIVNVTGYTKGRGFTGMIKRWNASRGPMSHGSKHHRKPGSNATSRIGPTRPGKRRPGRYGNEKVTIRNLKVIDILPDKNIILIKGGVPGAKNSLVKIVKN